ncbi:MAG TPA: hypothetical protein PLH03_06710 [Methylophilaceae bacterium]|nr:hypothetical protein [Methylophilaceae bacterium]
MIERAQRTLHIFDLDLARGGYAGLGRYNALRDFLLRNHGNRLVIVLHDTDHITRYCPRLMSLLRIFSHSISIHATEDHARSASDPFVIADQAHYVHRFHSSGARFLLALHDHQGASQLEERFGQLVEASQPASAVHNLGL